MDANIPSSPSAAARLRILWADDDEIVRRLGRAILSTVGCEVTSVRDGEEAVAQLAAHPGAWDVLVTDHEMPRIDGLTLVQRLPRLRFTGRVVVVSGSIDDSLAVSYRECGVSTILAKPFSTHELVAAVVGSAPG